MKAWLEDGVLMLTGETYEEHEYVRTQLVGRQLTTAIVPLHGVGTAGGFTLSPLRSPVDEPSAERGAVPVGGV